VVEADEFDQHIWCINFGKEGAMGGEGQQGVQQQQQTPSQGIITYRQASTFQAYVTPAPLGC